MVRRRISIAKLCWNVGDSVCEATHLISDAVSIPPWSLTPLMILGDWFLNAD